MARVRRLTEEGRAAFRAWIEAGAQGAAPRALLTDARMSEALDKAAEVEDVPFATRLECGRHLASRLGTLDRAAIRFDAGLWDWLSLFYIDQQMPKTDGTRRVGKVFRYCLDLRNRMWSRHQMRMNWLAVAEHGEHARHPAQHAHERARRPDGTARRTPGRIRLTRSDRGSRRALLGRRDRGAEEGPCHAGVHETAERRCGAAAWLGHPSTRVDLGLRLA